MNNQGETSYVGDLHFLAVSMLKYHIKPLHVAVLTFICRNNECEASDLETAIGISKSLAFDVLGYLHKTGAVEYRYVKHADRQRVKVWVLTEDGKRTVREMEKFYRLYQARSIRHACFTAGKEVKRG